MADEHADAQILERPVDYGQAEQGVYTLLAHLLSRSRADIGRDANLRETPMRVVRALAEMTAGYRQDPAKILKTFPVEHDQMVVLSRIRFVSLCEHHMLPFAGSAAIGYVPGKRIVGISKLARVVQIYARRLQVQERMTQQIADALDRHLKPRGVGVIIRAHHECMSCRGVRQSETEMITSAVHGVIRDKPEARQEFLGLAGI